MLHSPFCRLLHIISEERAVNKNNNKTVAVIVFTAVVLLLSVAMGVILYIDEHEGDVSEPSQNNAIDYLNKYETVYIDGEPYKLRKGISTLLIMGIDASGNIDGDESKNAKKSDFLALAVFDKTKKSVTVLHINRDTMTEVTKLGPFGEAAGTTFEQITLAYGYGDGLQKSAENTVKAVSNLLYGIKIDNYLSMNMSAIPVINDKIGGVTVTVNEDMTSVDPAFVKGATLKLTGTQAINFVRARGSLDDSTNIARMERQKQYMNGLAAALSENKEALQGDYFADMLAQIANYSIARLGSDFLSELSNYGKDYRFDGVISPEGEAEVGKEFMEFYVDDDSLKQILVQLFFDRVEES